MTILGAGLQGVCSAFALSSAGHSVTLIDQDPRPLNRASRRNTGKIHLGHTYAADSSMRTAALMMRSALAFGPLLEHWIGTPLDWESLRSPTFTYLVASDSLVAPDDLIAHYTAVEAMHAALASPDSRYLGRRLDWLFRPIDCPRHVRQEAVTATIETPEVAVRLEPLMRLLEQRVAASTGITSRFGHRVRTIERSESGFTVTGTTSSGDPWREDSEVMVNCLWGERLRVDALLGLVPDRTWVHRLKYRLFAKMPAGLSQMSALSIVLGPHGDVVPMGDEVYLQWYPACRRGWSRALSPPTAWDAACSGESDDRTLQELAAEAKAGLSRFVPELVAAEPLRCDAGLIFAWGETEISDPGSELHQRHGTGVHAHKGYFSIDTGKLTCAPLFADELRQHLSQGRPA